MLRKRLLSGALVLVLCSVQTTCAVLSVKAVELPLSNASKKLSATECNIAWIDEIEIIDATPFHDGIAKVRYWDAEADDYVYYYVNAEGKPALPPAMSLDRETLDPVIEEWSSFGHASDFSCGLAVVGYDNTYYIIDASGEPIELFGPAASEVSDKADWDNLAGIYLFNSVQVTTSGVIIGMMADYQGYIAVDCSGELLLRDDDFEDCFPSPASEEIWPDENGMILVSSNNSGRPMDGLLDLASGELVVPLIYESIEPFSEGYARVYLNGKCGYINTAGELVIPCEYGVLSQQVSEGVVWLQEEKGETDGIPGAGEMRCVDLNLVPVSPTTYDEALPFSDGLSAVSNRQGDGLIAGAIDHTGALVIPMEYENIGQCVDGLSPVKKNGKWGYINKENQVVIDFEFDYCQKFQDGLAWVKKDGVWGILEHPDAMDAQEWASAEIQEAKDLSLTTFRTSRQFSRNITRVQFTELLVNLVEQVTGKAENAKNVFPFSDTADLYVRKAYALGIVQGTGDDNCFSPNEVLTREQASAMLYRTIERLQAMTGKTVLGPTEDLSRYNDHAQVSPWALEAVSSLTGADIIGGTSDTTLSPKDTTTVEQAILLTRRAYQLFKT